ncbi:P-II family nitrogen regulator [Thermodesulforhabdus norvegica]|uniref:Nitrogen regulatory protein P-II family n=1 Tax=Thermodesulforhabdus norvegica TaxID=39841 RepID=A0A1I4UIZ0_9BACT|nr:P-II family nitrogen regulator [Thermodesulforhabdus norvegica]SFM88865.1 nitrogen regulatory protein P-II family [Thermodesulforhabdus norvegica]
MKMIKAIVRPEKVETILAALSEEGFPAVTRVDVVGRGKQGGLKVGEVVYDEIPKSLLMIVVPDGDVSKICDVIKSRAYTGRYGDGKIFISTVEKTYTIRTGEIES